MLISALTNEILQDKSFDKSLQELVNNRTADHERLVAYKNNYNKLEEIFNISTNTEAFDILVGLQSAVAQSNYIKGFAEGMKFALMAEKL